MVGRPRQAGERHGCGKLVQAPLSAPDLLEKRKILVGADRAANPKAAYPLGILYLRRALFLGDYRAGMQYAALHHVVWGSRHPKSHLADLVAGIVPSAIDVEARERRLLEASAELGRANVAVMELDTRCPFDMLQNIAVYERPMRFMDTSRARTPAAWAADQRDIEALLEALDCLARLWGFEKRAA
jgi:hypothetical protein